MLYHNIVYLVGSVCMEHTEEKVLQLVSATRAGDLSSFATLLTVYRPLLLSQVSLFSASAEDEDLMQDASLALHRAALSYRAADGVTFGAYAKVCIRHALISAKRKARPVVPESSLPPEEAVAEHEEPSALLIQREEMRELYRTASECLSAYEIRVFLMYIRGYTPKQIAPCLGKTEKSVSNAIARMLAKLRARFS